MEMIHNRCLFADKQIIKLQETPGTGRVDLFSKLNFSIVTPDSIPEGETPYTVNVYAYDALVDVAKPGDRVEVTFAGSEVNENQGMKF